MAWAPGDAYLATASDDRTVRVWEAQTGAPLRVLRGHTHYVMSCAFSASGALLASAGFDETVVVWDVAAGTAIRTIPAHSDPVSCVAFSGELHAPAIVSTSFDGLMCVPAAGRGSAWGGSTRAPVCSIAGELVPLQPGPHPPTRAKSPPQTAVGGGHGQLPG